MLDLLIEAMQGPCVPNQDHLASTRLVEVLMSICRGKFPEREYEEGEVSEPELRCKVAVCMNALLEGRRPVGTDLSVYQGLLSWVDPLIMRRRFVYTHQKKL